MQARAGPQPVAPPGRPAACAAGPVACGGEGSSTTPSSCDLSLWGGLSSHSGAGLSSQPAAPAQPLRVRWTQADFGQLFRGAPFLEEHLAHRDPKDARLGALGFPLGCPSPRAPEDGVCVFSLPFCC